MANQTTMIADLINPQVMADMISAKVEKKMVVAPFAKIDTTLEGRPGDTITVPQYAYIGDAKDIAEGARSGNSKTCNNYNNGKSKKSDESGGIDRRSGSFRLRKSCWRNK